MPIHKLAASFNAGELSPLMDSRVAVEKYDAGCRKLRNFLLHTHGPIFRRPGTEFIWTLAADGTASRLLEFNFSATTRFVIEMAVGRFRFFSNQQLVQKGGNDVSPSHPYTADELFEVQMKQVNDVCYFSHRNHHPLKLIRKADDDWTCEPVPMRYPPLLDEFVEKESVATPTVTEIYNTTLCEAEEVTFAARTPGTIPSFTVNAPPRTTISCHITNGSATVTMTSTSGRSTGELVEGTGIPANTTIATIVNGTTITLSANATASSATASITFAKPWFTQTWTWPSNPYTCGITSGSKTVTMASTAGRSVGETVSGTNIPGGAFVTAVVNSTTLTISANATATTGSASLTFGTAASAKALDLQVLRPGDSTWQTIAGATLSLISLTAPPALSYRYQARANGTKDLLIDRQTVVGVGPWALNTTLTGFFASNTAAGSVPNLTFRFVYRGDNSHLLYIAQTNDLPGYKVTATDWESNATDTTLVHVPTSTTSHEITTAWTLPATIPGSRTLAWQILNGSGAWMSIYSMTLSTLLTASTFRLRYYVVGTTMVLEEKQSNGTWAYKVGGFAMPVATSWTVRMLFGPDSVQGIGDTEAKPCGIVATSTTVTMGSTTGRAVGEGVNGTGIPWHATITAVPTSTTITISSAATVTNTAAALIFTKAQPKVVLTDAVGSVALTAYLERQKSGPAGDRGLGGITIPAGQWQARIEVGPGSVPTGAVVNLQRWNGSSWVPVTTFPLVSGKTSTYSGLSANALTVDTLYRFQYVGGTSHVRSPGSVVIERVVYPASEAITLEVSDRIGTGRTMLAKDASGNPVAELFKPEMVGGYWQIAHRRELSYAELVGVAGTFTPTPSLIPPGISSNEIRVSGKWDLFTYGTWTGVLHLERKRSDDTYEIIRSWKSRADRNVTASGNEEQDVDLRLRAETGMVGAAATGAAVPRFILEAADSRSYGLVKITEYVSPSKVKVDVVRTIGSVSPTPLWAEGAWSNHRGYPAAVGLHEARLWFGGSKYQPQTLWASVSNDFENFRRSTLDDGGLNLTLAAESSNSIRWISSATALLIGTGGEEWALRSAQEGQAITPTSVRVERQSGYSSMPLGAKLANEVTLFVQRDGRRLRQLSFAQDSQSFTAADLTVLAPHVTQGGVRQIAFQQAPSAIIWIVTNEGKLIGMTFEREQNVFGWHVHDTDGEIESVAVLHGTPADEVWLAVKRTINGAECRYLERMQPKAMAADWTDQETLIYLDSAKLFRNVLTCATTSGSTTVTMESTAGRNVGELVTGAGMDKDTKVASIPNDGTTLELSQAATATAAKVSLKFAWNVFTGLKHLEGKECAVLADGMVHRTITVPSSGSITLDVKASTVIVGLPYTSEVQPMKQEVQMQDGTAQGRRFKLQKVTVRVDHSLGGEVNANPADASLPWARMPSAIVMGEATPLFSGERDVIVESRHEDAVNLTVRQSDPFPLNITALIMNFDVYDAN